MSEPITITTASGLTVRLDSLPRVNVTLPPGPLDDAGLPRVALDVATGVQDQLTNWLLEQLPEPRPFTKQLDHDERGRITAVREHAADPSKLVTAREISAELLRRVYVPLLVDRINAAAREQAA